MRSILFCAEYHDSDSNLHDLQSLKISNKVTPHGLARTRGSGDSFGWASQSGSTHHVREKRILSDFPVPIG